MTRGHADRDPTLAPAAGERRTTVTAVVGRSGLTVALVALLCLAVAGVTGAPPVRAQEPDQQDVEAAQEKLRALQARHQLAVQEYLEAEQRLGELDAEIEQSQARIGELTRQAQQREQGAAAVARRLYTARSAASGMAVLGAGDVSEAGRRAAYLKYARQRHRSAIEEYRSTRVRLQREAEELETARAEAAELRQELTERAERIDAEVAQQQAEIASLREQIEQRRARERRARERALARQRAEQASQEPADDGGEGTGDPEPADDGGEGTGEPESADDGGGGAASPEPTDAPSPSDAASAAVEAALAKRGTPYEWGAEGPDSFDCSGLTMWAWRHGGVNIPRTSRSQYRGLPKVSRSEIRPGDLLFFGDPIHHVGMYIGDGQMVEAPYSGQPVRINDIQRPDYVGAVRPGG